MEKYKKQADMILGAFFLLFIIVCLVINLIVPDKELSVVENRSLTLRPHLSMRDISDGTYMEQVEAHLSDQFVGREAYRGLYSTVDQIGGNRESGRVYRGKKGQLLEAIATPDVELLDTTVESICAFAGRHTDLNTTMLLVPDAAQVLQDRLPLLAQHTDQKIYFDKVKAALPTSVNWVDAEAALRAHKDEKRYYKTDHHWTTAGAHHVYEAAAPALGIQDPGSFTPYTVTNDFHGSLIAASGFDRKLGEDIEVMLPDEQLQVLVSYVDEQKITTSLYDTKKLSERDGYQVFLGGNTSLMDIRTTVESERHLLIFKDSFANCFIPFLANRFGEIVVVDARYYSGGADELVKNYGITDVLFLYSGNIFFNDNSLSGVLDANANADMDADANADEDAYVYEDEDADMDAEQAAEDESEM